jgi:hypothetical protein
MDYEWRSQHGKATCCSRWKCQHLSCCLGRHSMRGLVFQQISNLLASEVLAILATLRVYKRPRQADLLLLVLRWMGLHPLLLAYVDLIGEV